MEPIIMTIPHKEISYTPGGKPTQFTVRVVNGGDRFASFQLDITPAGGEQKQDRSWYSISPEISTKNPPGDAVEFSVAIIDAPIQGFVGLVNLTVRAFSLELRREVRQVIRLELQEGRGQARLQLELPFHRLQVAPLDILEMPVLVRNPNQQPTNVTLTCKGIPETWLIEGATRQFQIKAGGQFSTNFLCQPPFGTEAVSKVYPLTITATHTNGPEAEALASLDILPRGSLSFECDPKVLTIPKGWRWRFWRNDTATFQIHLNNASNLEQKVSIDILSESNLSYKVELDPNQVELPPLAQQTLELNIQRDRPWLGITEKLEFQVKSQWHDRRLEPRSPSQTIELRLQPIIPSWAFIVMSALLLTTLWYFSWLNPDNPFSGHRSAVTSVQLDGLTTIALSSSNDQTLRKWYMDGFFNPLINQDIGVVAQASKAMRVVRFRPVNNDLAAIGMENGDIQLWSLLEDKPTKPLFTYSYQRDDRVFGLTFTLDSRFLFSSHGSGLVLRWTTDRLTLEQKAEQAKQPLQTQKFDFAISDSALVGNDEKKLAVAGRFNQLAIWNWEQNTIQKVAYPAPGGQEDYIQSIDVAEYRPNLLATGDTQGFITIWDLTGCLADSDRSCTIIDRWGDGHQGKAIRSLSLSPSGCYLVSGGDDGRAMFWALTATGKRAGELNKGEILDQQANGITAVDVRSSGSHTIAIAGNSLGKVRAYQKDKMPNIGCEP
jgi:WD40 repeat protein